MDVTEEEFFYCCAEVTFVAHPPVKIANYDLDISVRKEHISVFQVLIDAIIVIFCRRGMKLFSLLNSDF